MGPVRLEAITWERLTEAVADTVMALEAEDGSPWLRVAVDGAGGAPGGDFARRVGEALRLRGRSALVVGTEGFLRPASLRLEYGREDPDSYYGGWFDTGALWREVFGPLEAAGAAGSSCPICGTRRPTGRPAARASDFRPGECCCCMVPFCSATGSRST